MSTPFESTDPASTEIRGAFLPCVCRRSAPLVSISRPQPTLKRQRTRTCTSPSGSGALACSLRAKGRSPADLCAGREVGEDYERLVTREHTHASADQQPARPVPTPRRSPTPVWKSHAPGQPTLDGRRGDHCNPPGHCRASRSTSTAPSLSATSSVPASLSESTTGGCPADHASIASRSRTA